MQPWKHFKTITKHKFMVMHYCFKIGLYKQGLLHDLSKYSPTEFLMGAKYYQGYRSPIRQERVDLGYSRAWLHHKGRNKHHFEYWMDYGLNGEENLIGVKMPIRYVAESCMDRIAASRIYEKEKYTPASALQYFLKGNDRKLMHQETAVLMEEWLTMLAQKGEGETLSYIKELLKTTNTY